MSKRQEADARAQRRAEALRRNLKRRKLQARGRAAAESERDAQEHVGPAPGEKPRDR